LTLVGCVAAVAAVSTPRAAEEIAFDYVEANLESLGLTPEDVDDLVVTDKYVSRHSGTTHVYLRQRIDGIEVFNSSFNVSIGRDGAVAHVGDRFVAGLAGASPSLAASLSPVAAVERAADALELDAPRDLKVLEPASGRDRRALLSRGGISLEDIPVRLVYQPLADGRLRLAWDLEIYQLDATHWWSVRVDAASGELLDTLDFVASEQYEVYPLPVESPHHTSPLPPADARLVEVDPYLDGVPGGSSPFGWHDTDGTSGAEFTITRGNTVHAYADTNNDNMPDTFPNEEPDGGAGLDFTGAIVDIDLSMQPSTYTQGSIANLFYWSNIIHDVTYQYGFDEASGNFQVNNYGNGGLGGDDVRAEGQDGGGNCNANFGTPPDGSRPRMQMYLCTNASPARDGSLDHGVVIHEYGHGISNRLTGGPSSVGCLGNTEQMGEGWSDYLGMMLTQEVGDVGTDARGVGTWLFGQGPNGPGIRPAPYSTDFGVNNFTYANVGGVSVPHGVGFIWATMLWEMTWELIDEQGFNPDFYDDWTSGGNNLAIQLVMDGMKLQPCGPGFVDGRDAILAADDVLTGTGATGSGVNRCTIWTAFARRGLGFSADQGSPNSVNDGTPAFDLPPFCETVGAEPTSRAICQGDTASYLVGVGDMFTAPPVTMSASGEPAGTTTSFSPNPVPGPLPATTSFDVSNTGSAAAGNYTITITGTDTDPNVFQNTVDLDVFAAVPAAPALTAPADGAVDEPRMPSFTWTAAADAVTYTIEIDDDPGFGSIDYAASDLTGLSHTPTSNLQFSTTYFWRVRADNPCGAGGNSTVFSFTTEVSPAACPPESAGALIQFEDDMESGAPGWTHSGTGDTWGLSSVRFASPITSFFAVDPETLSDQRLVSPSIVLPTDESPLTLRFQNYQAFETPNTDGRCWDAGILEISTNGGATWAQVPASAMLTDPYDNIIWNDTPGNNPITNDYGATDAWCNELEPFVESVVDINAWAGETVRFAWRLGSDSAAGNEGWYIDDVVVQSCASNMIFEDGFESGDTSAWSNAVP
jgi:extracellular elastinolytic metalloproteinase